MEHGVVVKATQHELNEFYMRSMQPAKIESEII